MSSPLLKLHLTQLVDRVSALTLFHHFRLLGRKKCRWLEGARTRLP